MKTILKRFLSYISYIWAVNHSVFQGQTLSTKDVDFSNLVSDYYLTEILGLVKVFCKGPIVVKYSFIPCEDMLL